ncbi:MAG TPA: class I SAM-dependent methyltransferase [Propionibacterium sp.]|nr:class I SAM-dependent methyltransferase [Propionibacterium sp.]
MATDFDAAARTWDTPEKVARSAAIAEAIAGAIPLDPAWSALDYGCGTGQLTWHLGDRIHHVTLTDTSSAMVEVAREHAAEQPDRYVIVDHDLTRGPLPYRVDLAYSAMALHHIDDTEAVLSNVTASINPGGWIALADLDSDPDNRFHPDDFDGHHGIDREALADGLRTRGYTDVSSRTAVTVTKAKDGVDHQHDIFLVTGRRGS